jgi:hypothetical protein
MTIDIAYRLGKALPPQPIKLKIPGWAGVNNYHGDNGPPQPWHCVPFVEGNTYGIEFLYPYEQEQRVTKKNGQIQFSNSDLPFKCFANGHYGYQSGTDIKVPEGYVIRLEPHPRYFVDEVGDVPLMLPGHIQTEWWTRFFFIVFKCPFEGQTHIFRYGEPFGQFLVVPQKPNYKLRQQNEQESVERSQLAELTFLYDEYLGKNTWRADNGIPFNDKYKQMSTAYAKDGIDGIKKLFEKCREKGEQKMKTIQSKNEKGKNKISRRLIKKTKK